MADEEPYGAIVIGAGPDSIFARPTGAGSFNHLFAALDEG
jgi:hypothetical protein